MDVEFLGFCKDADSFDSSSSNLPCNSSRVFVLWKPAIALRRKGGANVDNGLNFTACAIAFRVGDIEHIIKLQVESFELFTSVLI